MSNRSNAKPVTSASARTVASANPRTMASANPRTVASTNPRTVASVNWRTVASANPRTVASATPRTVALASAKTVASAGKTKNGVTTQVKSKVSDGGGAMNPSPADNVYDEEAAGAGGQSPRDISALTDNRSTVDLPTCRPPVCMPSGCVRTEQHYSCDRQMAKVLAQYVSPEERHKVLVWLDALDGMALGDDDLSERSLHMTCLVILLKCGRLVPPFTQSPPSCRSLQTLIDRHLFKRVLVECRKRRAYDPSRYEQPDRTVAQWPSQFFDQMPVPDDGIFCYGAAFGFK